MPNSRTLDPTRCVDLERPSMAEKVPRRNTFLASCPFRRCIFQGTPQNGVGFPFGLPLKPQKGVPLTKDTPLLSLKPAGPIEHLECGSFTFTWPKVSCCRFFIRWLCASQKKQKTTWPKVMLHTQLSNLLHCWNAHTDPTRVQVARQVQDEWMQD